MVTIESRIEEVIVYASGARVRRVANLKAPIPPTVRLTGLPLSVIDDTVRSEIDGPAIVTAVRVGEDRPEVAASAEEGAELRTARRRVAIAEADAERLDGALEQLTAAPVVADDPTDEAPAPWAQVVAARRALVNVRAERELALRDRQSAAVRELDEARRALEVAAERDRRSGSARGAKLHEPRKHVELELALQGDGDLTVHFDYQVAAARWAPSYVARLDGEQLRFELRAVVAQDSGEDWQSVALKLSTAEPERFAALPELAPQKIGRRQVEPARRGFRAPPAGADDLYRDYDREFPRAPAASFSKTKFDDSTYEGRVPSEEPAAPPAPPPPMQASVPSDQMWDEESSNAMPDVPMVMPMTRSKGGGGFAGAIGGVLAAPIGLAAAAAQSIARARASGPGGGATPKRHGEVAVAPPRLDYAGLVMQPPHTTDRGRLVAPPRQVTSETRARVIAGVTSIEQLAFPPGHDADWDHVYDYAFASDGAIDVASDSTWHNLAVTARAGAAKLHHVAVPREQADVFRIATIANPLDGPLLPGPIDVYDRGRFLVTSAVDYTPPGGAVEIGLGVDPQVKIARNVEFHEEAAGVLRGALKLIHAITIEVENLAPAPIQLELRERVPVVRDGDDDIEVTIGKIDPAWERWTPDATAPREARLRGGHRWRFSIAPNQKKLVRAAYEIKIAGKHELAGGNRREP